MTDLQRLDPNFAAPGADGAEWYDARNLPLEGKGWADTERFYDRLPARAKGIVRPPVWELSRHTSGMAVRFWTDSPSLWAEWTVWPRYYTQGHFAPTGAAGLDLYVRDGQGRWRFLAVGIPSLQDRTSVRLAIGLHPGRHEFMLYLPLYVGVETLRVGIEPGRSIGPLAPRTDKAMVFYGTSIVQGGCACRAGMSYAAILGRRLDRPIVNLGFSGNGQMEIEVAGLLAELDARLFVIDALPNVTPAQATERGEPFLRRLCTARPQTPVVVVENITYTNAFLMKDRLDGIVTKNDAIRRVCDTLRREGFDNLRLVEAAGILGDDGEAAVDGVHPTDVGFLRMADALEPVLRPLA